MQRTKDGSRRLVAVLGAVALLAAMGWGLLAPDSQAALADEAADSAEADASADSGEQEAWESWLDETYGSMADLAEEWAPEVTMTEDGTLIQRTPTDTGYFQMYYAGDLSYNTYYLQADSRGCNSCHEDLAETLANSEFFHLELDNGLGTTVTVEDCRLCHDYGYGYMDQQLSFGTLIHGVHYKSGTVNSCMSCHTATSDGWGMELWDDVKYDVMTGWSTMSDVEGVLSYDQDVLTDGWFDASWFYTEMNQEGIAKGYTDTPTDDETFESWEITVDGLVDEPYVITLGELIETAPSETFVATLSCIMNPSGGEAIANVECTGVSVQWLLEQAGIDWDDVTSVYFTAPDGWSRGADKDTILENGAYLVYEMNGERLEWQQGFPLMSFVKGIGVPASIRWCSEVTASDADLADLKMWTGWTMGENYDGVSALNGGHYFAEDAQAELDDAVWYNKPSVGVTHLLEGQIIEEGSYTFEGYAYAFDETVATIEFSLDRGATWQYFDVSDSDFTKWVYWYYTVDGLTPGSYILTVRATTVEGNVSYLDEEVMFNVKTADEIEALRLELSGSEE